MIPIPDIKQRTFKNFADAPLYIGFYSENIVTGIDIDLTDVLQDGWTAGLVLRRAGETLKYPAVSVLDGRILKVTFTTADTQNEGRGEATIKLIGPNGEDKKSETAQTIVLHALDTDGPAPEPLEEWFNHAALVLQTLEDRISDISGATATAESIDHELPADVDFDAETWAFNFKIPRGIQGLPGQDGSDAEVTAENIEAALGYHPAAPDGYYGESGGVFEYSTNFLGKGAPTNENNIVFRPTASKMSGQSWGTSHSVSGEIATIEKIKGRTLVFNQLIQNGNFDGTNAWGSLNGSISAVNNVCTYTISNITETSYENRLNANGYNYLNHIEGHKYLYTFYCKLPKDGVRIILSPTANAGADTGLNTTKNKWLRASAILSPGALSAIIWLRVINPSVLSVGDEIQFANVMIIDLTQMFGEGNEPATAEEFRAMFPLDYYEYNPGELVSFNGTGLKIVGFNAYHNGTAELLGGIQYQITGAYTALSFGGETVTPGSGGVFTVPKNGTLSVTGGDGTTCVHLVWTGLRDGEYEPYWERALALPVSTYFPDGMKSAGTVYDELTKDKAIQRIGSRAYASGDEDDSTVITDGTTTFYPLATPVETPISPALNLGYKVDDFGTEMILPQNDDEPVTAPMDAEIVYRIDYEGQVRNNDSINITKKSMDSFISAYNSSGAGTIAQTWDDVNKKYKYNVTSDIPTALADLTSDSTHRVVTDVEKTTWNAKADKPIIKTAMDSVAVAGAQYYLGTQSAVNITMPTDAELGQEIKVFFKSGATAATLTCDLTGFDYTPKANTAVLLTFRLVHKADAQVTGDVDDWTVQVEEG